MNRNTHDCPICYENDSLSKFKWCQECNNPIACSNCKEHINKCPLCRAEFKELTIPKEQAKVLYFNGNPINRQMLDPSYEVLNRHIMNPRLLPPPLFNSMLMKPGKMASTKF